MEAKHDKELSALMLAYQVVTKLGYTHSRIKKIDGTVNYPTLRSVRDGKNINGSTERYYLRLFVSIINEEYERCMQNGGDGANNLLILMKNLLLADLQIKLVKR